MRGRLAAENIVLRQQLIILRRRHRGRIWLNGANRALLNSLVRLVPTVLDAVIIVKPETVLRWHRKGFRCYWRWTSGNVGGRPPIGPDLRAVIGRMAVENPLWGAPRIHGELLKLGFSVSQSTVSKYLSQTYRPRGQTWGTFLANHEDAIAAIDLFVVPTIGFRLLYGLAILHLGRRELVWTNATANPTAEWIARQITEAFPWKEAPKYMLRDRDACYGAVFRRRLDAMGIRDRPVAPRSPWQNGYVERVIGSIRRECTDHTIVMGEELLRRTLKSYTHYHNRARTHLSLAKDAPIHRPIRAHGSLFATPHLGGLHHEYGRVT